MDIKFDQRFENDFPLGYLNKRVCHNCIHYYPYYIRFFVETYTMLSHGSCELTEKEVDSSSICERFNCKKDKTQLVSMISRKKSAY